MPQLTQHPAWKALQKRYRAVQKKPLKDFFSEGSDRFQRYSLEAAGLFLDYSKNPIDKTVLLELKNLAEQCGLKSAIEKLFSGAVVNVTENLPARHTELRALEQAPREVQHTLRRLQDLSEAVREGKWKGVSGEVITDVIHIGIGGSHLGPQLGVEVFQKPAEQKVHIHFLSNADTQVWQVLQQSLTPERTLVVIASKSFTTLETMLHAKAVRAWFEKSFPKDHPWQHHFWAVTAAVENAKAWGIAEEHILPIWDWVGGRYSVWSAIGLPIVFAVGFKKFQEFLEGAHAMDVHFRETDFLHNMPVLLALIGIWQRNFFGVPTQAVIPYAENLRMLPAYLQQLEMESNGKSVTQKGENVDYDTVPVIWGQVGSNSQHAFHQMLHQGTERVSVDFILLLQDKVLVAQALSQAEALMMGRKAPQVYCAQRGNQPSNMILLSEVSPRTLGALLTLYEHKVFVQSVIWDINPFDQWGIELGKQISVRVLTALENDASLESASSSTQGLIARYRRENQRE